MDSPGAEPPITTDDWSDPRLSPLESEVLAEYAKLKANLDALSVELAELAASPSAVIADSLRQLERKTSLVCTALKSSVYGIVLQQQIEFGGDDGGSQDRCLSSRGTCIASSASTTTVASPTIFPTVSNTCPIATPTLPPPNDCPIQHTQCICQCICPPCRLPDLLGSNFSINFEFSAPNHTLPNNNPNFQNNNPSPNLNKIPNDLVPYAAGTGMVTFAFQSVDSFALITQREPRSASAILKALFGFLGFVWSSVIFVAQVGRHPGAGCSGQIMGVNATMSPLG